MSKSGRTRRNLSLVSISEARSRNVLSDADELEKVQIPAIDIEALRTIGRIVQDVKERIGTGEKTSPEQDLRHPPPEIQAAQLRLAQIAVRILTEKDRKTDEK